MIPVFLIILAMAVVILGAAIFWLLSYTGVHRDAEDPWVLLCSVTDAGQLAFFKSLLEGAEIPYAVVGERAQNLFGLGRLGTGYNMITGPVRIQVPTSRVTEAQQLLQDQS